MATATRAVLAARVQYILGNRTDLEDECKDWVTEAYDHLTQSIEFPESRADVSAQVPITANEITTWPPSDYYSVMSVRNNFTERALAQIDERTYDTLDLDITGSPRVYMISNGQFFYHPRPTVYETGTHTAANHDTIMTDAAASFGMLTGYMIYNTTDGSKGEVTANTTTTATVAALTGGTLNRFTTADAYIIAEELQLRYRKMLTRLTADGSQSVLPESWDRAIILVASYLGFDETGNAERSIHYRRLASGYIRNQQKRLVEELQDRNEPIAPIGIGIVGGSRWS